MTKRDDYPRGAPCWVDTWQPDLWAAREFYGQWLGWSFDAPVPVAGGPPRDYLTARLAGQSVAGIGQAPPSSPAAVWSTYVRVGDLEEAIARAQRAGGAILAGPVGIGSAARLAILRDATGVPLGMWQAFERMGAEVVGEPGAWAMSSLHTTDLAKANAFYGAVFGWELEPVPDALFSQWTMMGRRVAVASATDGVAVPPHWSVNFAVGDVDAHAERATVLGGTVLMAPFDTPGFRNAVVADPQGAVIAISQSAR